jgi:hypothetical protein
MMLGPTPPPPGLEATSLITIPGPKYYQVSTGSRRLAEKGQDASLDDKPHKT